MFFVATATKNARSRHGLDAYLTRVNQAFPALRLLVIFTHMCVFNKGLNNDCQLQRICF